MSRIDALIADLCPDGVKYRGLGEVGEFIRGNGLQKSDLTDAGVGAIHYGQIHTIYGVWTDTTRSFVTEQMAQKLRKARSGDLVIATTSEDDAAVAKAVAWVGEGEVAVSSDAYIYSHSLEPKYVSYFFQTDQFRSQKTRHITGTKVRRISGESLAKIKIPVPPLKIQQEIVLILDKFTKLEAELEARRRQYRHYRDQLLSFAAAGSGQRAAGSGQRAAEVRWATLGDVASYSRSRIGASSLDEDSYIGVDNLLPDMRGRTKSNYVPTEGSAVGYQSGDILIGRGIFVFNGPVGWLRVVDA